MLRIYKVLIGVSLLYVVFLGSGVVDVNPFGPLSNAQIGKIYGDVAKASGEVGRAPPLTIVKSSEVNAYTTKDGIFIYTGLSDKADANTIALVLGHELAHYMMGHVTPYYGLVQPDTRVLELQADKYGAFLAMRAGYDVCDGRQMFKLFTKLYGDDMAMDHPSNAFRYDQLNVNCD